MRRIAALLASLSLVLTAVPAASASPPTNGTWIVQLAEDVNSVAAAPQLSRQYGGSVGRVWQWAINGFTFEGSSAAAAALARNPLVTLVEPNAQVWLDTTQSGATWGLDRIDQETLPLNSTYTHQGDGTGVTAYVIDSGIRYTHNDFDGARTDRAVLGTDIVGGIAPAGSDCNGHGTHVAGTIGGTTYGVAKDVTLVSVRVFGCDGGSTWDVIIDGIEWVIQDHEPGEPAVANMSLGGGASSSVDTATNNLINDGVATAVAAGNGNFFGRQADACNYSPARVPAAMTISATDKTDTKASWANYGECVDWFAPGVSVTSAWIDTDNDTNTISGTSMATPHTAGVAALYLEVNPGQTPQQVRDAIFANTIKNVVSSSSTANNDMLYMGFLNNDGGGGNSAPVAHAASVTTSEGEPVLITLTGSDVETCDLAFSIVDGAGAGSLSGITNVACTATGDSATVTYTPESGADDLFTFKVNDGTTDSAAATVTIDVVPTSTGRITLEVRAFKVKGVKQADLSWSGATSDDVDVYRDGSVVATTANDGSYTDNLQKKGGGSHTYKVCEAGTTTCSNEATASY